MKKTYGTNRRGSPKNKSRRATSEKGSPAAFVQHISKVASPYIVETFGQLSRETRSEVERFALQVLRSKHLKKNEALRNGAARLVVALLPKTFATLQELLSDQSSPLWYEVHFIIFSALDREDLSTKDQKRALGLVRKYLIDVSSSAGYAAWKAGDLLGDEWRDSETVGMLEELLFSAKHAAGRKAALHGIEHAIKKAMPADRERLFSLIRKVASADQSAELRKSASLALEGVGCHNLTAQKASASSVQPS
jgi:hypothetical protein